jgi:hypothetical protein
MRVIQILLATNCMLKNVSLLSIFQWLFLNKCFWFNAWINNTRLQQWSLSNSRLLDNHQKYVFKNILFSHWSYAQIKSMFASFIKINMETWSDHFSCQLCRPGGFQKSILQFLLMELDDPHNYSCCTITN